MTLGEKLVQARRSARAWLAENHGPPGLEHRLTRRLLDWLSTRDELEPSDLETIAREVVQDAAARRDSVARHMARGWRTLGRPTASAMRLALVAGKAP